MKRKDLRKKRDSKHFFLPNRGVREGIPGLVAAALSETLLSIPYNPKLRKEMIDKFWECLYSTSSVWGIETEFNSIPVEDAILATEILYNNVYGILSYSIPYLLCPICYHFFEHEISHDLTRGQSWECPNCGELNDVSKQTVWGFDHG